MSDADWEKEKLLREAKAKAEKIIASLIAQQQDLDRFATQIAPEKLAQGQKAFADAIGSTVKTVHEIDQALRAGNPTDAGH
jgi:ABC-type transporter Mla subunit MlaD